MSFRNFIVKAKQAAVAIGDVAKASDDGVAAARGFTAAQDEILEKISKMVSASANGAEEVKKFIHAVEQQSLAYRNNDANAAAYWSRRLQEIAAFIRAQHFDITFDPTQFTATYNKNPDPFGKGMGGKSGGTTAAGGTTVGVGIGGQRVGGGSSQNTAGGANQGSYALGQATGNLR